MILSQELRAAVELFLCSIIWGFGFVAAVWTLELLTPPELLFLRFLFAFIFGEVVTWTLQKNKLSTKELRQGLLAGLILGAVLLLQTWGLLFTTATKSGFITSLYVILIPLFLHFIWKKETPKYTYFNVFLALLGTSFLILPQMNRENLSLNKGDVLTLFCSVFAALHIIYIDLRSKHISNGFQFNNYQSLGAALFCLPALAYQNTTQKIFEKSSALFNATHLLPVVGLLSLALGSSVLAFYIQIRSQKILKPTTASLFFLLEAPFAFLFGSLFLKEVVTPLQAFGMAIVLLAGLLQLLWEHGARNLQKKVK